MVLQVDHFNNSVATLDISRSEYTFLTRQHNQTIKHLGYNPKTSKIVTLSLDNTIRIWALASGASEDRGCRLEYKIKQEY